jgi:hypothetical protein
MLDFTLAEGFTAASQWMSRVRSPSAAPIFLATGYESSPNPLRFASHFVIGHRVLAKPSDPSQPAEWCCHTINISRLHHVHGLHRLAHLRDVRFCASDRPNNRVLPHRSSIRFRRLSAFGSEPFTSGHDSTTKPLPSAGGLPVITRHSHQRTWCLANAYWAKRMYPQAIEQWKAAGQLFGD